MATSSSASPERDHSGREVTSVYRCDDWVRAAIALFVVSCFVSVPGVGLMLMALGQLSVADLTEILPQFLLYLSPFVGVVLGYYFRNP